MKIETIEAVWVRAPIPEAQRHRSDLGVADAFDATIVRVETACGLVGWGEAAGFGRQQGRQCGARGGDQPRARPGAGRRRPP